MSKESNQIIFVFVFCSEKLNVTWSRWQFVWTVTLFFDTQVREEDFLFFFSFFPFLSWEKAADSTSQSI